MSWIMGVPCELPQGFILRSWSRKSVLELKNLIQGVLMVLQDFLDFFLDLGGPWVSALGADPEIIVFHGFSIIFNDFVSACTG